MPCYARIEIVEITDEKAMTAAAKELDVDLVREGGKLRFKTYDVDQARRFKMVAVIHQVMNSSSLKGYMVTRKTQGASIIVVARRYSPNHASVKVEILPDATYKVFAEGLEGARAVDLTTDLKKAGVIIEQHVGHHPHHHGDHHHDQVSETV